MELIARIHIILIGGAGLGAYALGFLAWTTVRATVVGRVVPERTAEGSAKLVGIADEFMTVGRVGLALTLSVGGLAAVGAGLLDMPRWAYPYAAGAMLAGQASCLLFAMLSKHMRDVGESVAQLVERDRSPVQIRPEQSVGACCFPMANRVRGTIVAFSRKEDEQ